jgi:UDP-N-acetylmuramoyl-L-alanyl-D-glutamate--2,6-diaminopimelate ligase
VTLRELLEAMDAPDYAGDRALEVRGLASDSRRVRPGDLFFALPGLRQDGSAFVRQALEGGAVAAVVDRGAPPQEGALVRVPEASRALAEAADRFHGSPSRRLRLAGVTGTNGKTTVTWMLESIFRAAGLEPGVIGTTGIRLRGVSRPNPYTTPGSAELQALLREMLDAGVQAVALEVSSHALVQRRAWGLAFDVVAFTNLTQDHLDYHGTLESYLDAKLMLFDGRNGATGKATVAIVNADDPAAPRVEEAARRGGLPILRCSAEPRRAAGDLAVQVTELAPGADGLRLRIRIAAGVSGTFPGGEHSVTLPLLGRYNASNAATAFAAALALGIQEAAILRGLESMPAVPGRLERVDAGRGRAVVVDFAHTPDALERALGAMREHFPGRLLLVFGCGGDRDRAKRPWMGRVAREGADESWVTSDNPRSEDPAAIAAEILAGAGGVREGVHLELDRRAAIAAALASARPGDAVLIAGKGHETTQAIGERVLPFDDREVARRLLGAGGRG